MLCVDATESFYNKYQKLAGEINENALVDADIVPGATQVLNILIFTVNRLNK